MKEESELWLLTDKRFHGAIEQLITQTQNALTNGRTVEAQALTAATRMLLEQYKAWKRDSEPYRWYWEPRDRPSYFPPCAPPPPHGYPGRHDERRWLLPNEDILRSDE
ncbi:MAG: hypothetical protein SFU56_22205 [Capsulimonadales bacterium]|nr:hypothetical protein [Capsulimonadales bacterium]